MADALISTTVAGSMYAASICAAGVSLHKIKLENEPKKIPVMGVMGAFVFAAQMLNFNIPGTGASGHLCGCMLLSAVLGPFAGFITMIGILLLQCLMFADGGLLALGANVWNMAFYGCFIGALLIWHPMVKNKLTKKRIIASSVIGCVLTLQLGAFSCVVETMLSGITELPFTWFAAVMQPIHLVIGLVEGLISAAVLCFIYESLSDMLWGCAKSDGTKERLAVKEIIIVIAVIAALFAFVVSHFASENPDGLEWSIEQLTGDTELRNIDDAAHAASESIQESTALLPDYGLESGGDEAVVTSVTPEGLLFSAGIVLAAAAVSYVAVNVRRRRREL